MTSASSAGYAAGTEEHAHAAIHPQVGIAWRAGERRYCWLTACLSSRFRRVARFWSKNHIFWQIPRLNKNFFHCALRGSNIYGANDSRSSAAKTFLLTQRHFMHKHKSSSAGHKGRKVEAAHPAPARPPRSAEARRGGEEGRRHLN